MNPLGCEPGRKAGAAVPGWYPRIRQLIEANLGEFPAGIDIPFLAAWIERESDGRYALQSRLDEVGYFQLHPSELEDMVGKDKVQAALASVESSPEMSMRWGAALLRHYDERMTPLGIRRGSEVYHGLLKTFHWSPPRAVRWIRHVTNALGHPPETYNEFLQTAVMLKQGGGDLPPLPSCSGWQLLKRRDAFVIPGVDGAIIGRLGVGGLWAANQAVYNVAMVQRELSGALGSFDIAFSSPIEDGIVFSGWGRPRSERGGWHQGIDIGAVVGTPVHAAADGEVTGVREATFAHRYIVVTHPGGWTSRYMHLGDRFVKVGDLVNRGKVIAEVGRSSTPHVHFDLHLRTDLLPEYAARFGVPKTGWGTKRSYGTAVPSEPLIPVAGYSKRTITDARVQGIPLFTPKRFPWEKAFASFGVVALLAALGVGAYRR